MGSSGGEVLDWGHQSPGVILECSTRVLGDIGAEGIGAVLGGQEEGGNGILKRGYDVLRPYGPLMFGVAG